MFKAAGKSEDAVRQLLEDARKVEKILENNEYFCIFALLLLNS